MDLSKFFFVKLCVVVTLWPVFFVTTAFSRDDFRAKIISPANGVVGQYETIEIGVQSPMTDRLFSNFSTKQKPSLNPYNPADFSFQAQFICHGKTCIVNAFYFEDAHADDSSNTYKTSPSQWPWRVRFAPPDTGTWQVLLITGKSPQFIPHGTGITFQCVPSRKKGWLKIADDHRHLCFQNGDPFFAIGQNIAWADAPVLRGRAGQNAFLYTNGYYDIFKYINDLADNGGNYVRVIMMGWSTGIEWETAGEYDQSRAAALDSIISLAEKRGIYIHLCIDSHASTIEKFQPPYGWEDNPYRKALNLQQPVDFLTNDSAQKLYKQRLRYIEARWGYSPNVALFEFLSEQDFWKDYASHINEFTNWHAMMSDYLRNDLHDTLRLLTTCFGAHIYDKIFSLSQMQLTSYHYYTDDFLGDRRRFAMINGKNFYDSRRGLHVRWDKPCIFGELGLTGYGADPNDFEGCNDITFHNDLWSTSFMGCYGTGLNWWQWSNDNFRKANFPALRFFMDSVCNNMKLLTIPKFASANGIEIFYSENTGGSFAAGWMHNTSYWWGNVSDSCSDRNGKKIIHPKDDDKFSSPQDRTWKTVFVYGMKKKTRYLVTFYDTRTPGKILTQYFNIISDRRGRIKMVLPRNVPDCAFKIKVAGLTTDQDSSW